MNKNKWHLCLMEGKLNTYQYHVHISTTVVKRTRFVSIKPQVVITKLLSRGIMLGIRRRTHWTHDPNCAVPPIRASCTRQPPCCGAPRGEPLPRLLCAFLSGGAPSAAAAAREGVRGSSRAAAHEVRRAPQWRDLLVASSSAENSPSSPRWSAEVEDEVELDDAHVASVGLKCFRCMFQTNVCFTWMLQK